MKKITLITLFLIAFIANAQTYAIYTEDASIGAGVNSLRFNNGAGFSGSESTTSSYEGTKNYLLTYTAAGTYFHGIFFPRNSTNSADVTVDLSAYSYYNIAIKTSSATQFFIRMRGNGVTAKVLINPASNSYGFTNDNQWHFMSIPFADFIPENIAFSKALISEILVFRSNDATGVVVSPNNNFAFDNAYASANMVTLGINEKNTLTASIFPNPATNVLNINSLETIKSIKIYNLLGQTVLAKSSKNSMENIDVSSLNNGTYIINIESEEKKYTTKFIKK
ncbi:T9SS type A sorting domain-containing protein [Flavobacterium ovatum]|uniref:T9SS type A sorting domain-containing protein n=1 Tax=Flavobacterium ovatum TaxID=1928857 RepID=UPI00344F5FC6